ncbi:MAG: tol-pal system YbgF family protein [Dehalococcoidia bacterium]
MEHHRTVLEEARALLDGDRLDEAAIRASEALAAIDSESTQAAEHPGGLDVAIPGLESLSELGGDAEELLAEIAFKKGDFADALDRSYRAIRRSSRFRALPHFIAGEALHKLGDTELAIGKFKIILEFAGQAGLKTKAKQRIDELLDELGAGGHELTC